MSSNEKLIALRKQSGLNRKQFSTYLGVPYDTMASWEKGARRMPDYVYELIAFKISARDKLLDKSADDDDYIEEEYEQMSFDDLICETDNSDTRLDFMPWITRDDEELKALAKQGMSTSQIAARLKRSEERVTARMKRLGIK